MTRSRGIARALEGFGYLALAQGEAERTLRLCGAAAHLRMLIGATLPPAEQSKLEQILQPVRDSLGEKESHAAWVEGSAMTLERTIEYCLEE